jgi:hypothetical protein
MENKNADTVTAKSEVIENLEVVGGVRSRIPHFSLLYFVKNTN